VQVVVGYNEFNLDITGLSSGIYLIRLDAAALGLPQMGKLVIRR
jgi:hypothetical protein